ncbi:MAG: cell surface protein [Tissierellia bacterium]|nr:cell surface protein [Tissierellia bacterium]
MSKFKKRSTMILILSLILCGFSCGKVEKSIVNNVSETENINDLPYIGLMVCYSIDTNDFRELAGFADYIFIGYVDEMVNTEYKERHDILTNYKITVLDNIKGELIKDDSIPMVKDGGVSKDGKFLEIDSRDFMPLEGNMYVFYGNGKEDGSIFISGANSNYLLEENAEKELVETNEEYLKSHEILRKVIQGYENEIVSDRQRYKSKYEAK